MAHQRPDGQYGPYSSYNAYNPQRQQQQQQQQQHWGQQSPQPDARRSSFDAGDDTALSGSSHPALHQQQQQQQQQQYNQQTYLAYGQNQSAGQSPDLRSNSYSSYTNTINQHQQPHPQLQTLHSAQIVYNPANYAQKTSQSPVATSPNPGPPSHIQMPAGNYAAAHVPYNPAAYQNTNSQSAQSPFAYQPYGSPPLPQHNQVQTPPLPPKPPELAQSSGTWPRPGERRGAISTDSPSHNENQPPWSSHAPSPSYTAYTPPAPPPPPVHGSPEMSPNARQHTYPPPHSSPIQQQGGSAHPPRRLPSIPQGATRPPGNATSWHPRSTSLSASSHSRQSSVTAIPPPRPLPSPPPVIGELSLGQGSGTGNDATYDEIFAEVEAAVMGRRGALSQPSQQEPQPNNQSANGSARQSTGPEPRQSHQNSSSVDAVNAAGIEAMRLMDQDEANVNRNESTRTTATFLTGTTAVPETDVSRMQSYRSYTSNATYETPVSNNTDHHKEAGDDSDDAYIGIDISGGFDPGFGHTDLASPPVSIQVPPQVEPQRYEAKSPPQPPTHHYQMVQTPPAAPPPQQIQYVWSHSGEGLDIPDHAARTDTGGTGGLTEPTARRMSFDEDDEAMLTGQDPRRLSAGSASPSKGSLTRPTRAGSRPLPPTPEDATHLSPRSAETNFSSPHQDQSVENNENVRKTNSLNHNHGAQLLVPGRSVTDAEQRKKAGYRASFYAADPREPAYSSPGELDLPAIPDGRRRKFVPQKLSTKDFALCSEPWALSNVLAWLKEMASGESDLKEQPLVEALIGLFTHKVPTMNIADAEVLGAALVNQMIREGAIVREEEWVKFGDLEMSGVIYQLTGEGCYSSKVHTSTIQGRCYSHHCMRTLKKIDLQAQQLPPEKKAEDWATFYKITADQIKDVDKKEVELQNNLHEIVTSEDYFIDQLDVLLVLYRDGLSNSTQPIIALAGKQSKFVSEVFDKVPAVKKANEDHLLAQLKYRQQEQGPWVTGFSDIFREWIRRAKSAYIEYAYNLPNAIFQVKAQLDQNVLFKQFLDQVREHPRSRRLDWNTYLKAPVTRLQRYGLLLETVKKNMKTDAHAKERANLEIAIKEIKEVTLECDAKVDEMTKRTDMQELGNKLKLRPGMDNVQLNLNHLGRQVLYRGDLTRRSANNMNWVDIHAILFDHYMVLGKVTNRKDASGNVISSYYDVSRLPIPMDLLVLDSADEGAVMKHGVKGILPIGSTQVKQTGSTTPDMRLSRVQSSQSANGMPVAQRANSGPAVLASGVPVDENIIYPFRVQHLGKEDSYVLYASSAKVRSEWVDAIILAKKRHAASLYAQNAEPFKLRVLADTAFGYSLDSAGGLPVHIPGTPLDRALRANEEQFSLPAQINPACRATVNCATTFALQHGTGPNMLAVGTDFGVYITQEHAPRSWYKAINATHVSQIQVLEDFAVLLIVADKALIAFHLDGVIPPAGKSASDNSNKRIPQKLSGTRDVGYFAVGRMKERMLVFYKKRDGISSTFKVLEPIWQKSTTASTNGSGWGRSRFGLKKGSTDFFRDFDDFYIATDTYGINLFASSLAIASSKGIEVLTLDKKRPISIPDLRGNDVQSIAARLQNTKPLGMFRLNDHEFLLVFEEVGVYVDKHGDVSRAVVMEFVGRARQAALHRGTYLVLVDDHSSFVEVRNANNGRLRQIISGHDVRMLDDGMGAGMGIIGGPVVPGQSRGTIKISMQHPLLERQYVVLEMQVNEGITD